MNQPNFRSVGILLVVPFFIVFLFFEALADLRIKNFGIFGNINYLRLRRCRLISAIFHDSLVVFTRFNSCLCFSFYCSGVNLLCGQLPPFIERQVGLCMWR